MKQFLATCITAGLLVGAGAAESSVAISGEGTIEPMATKNAVAQKLTVADGERTHVLTALGSGLRKKFAFKVYEAVLYFAEGAALPPDPYPALVTGNLPKRIEMHFLRDVDHGKILEAWDDAMKNAIRDGKLPADSEANQAQFLGYFSDRDLSEGQVITLTWLPGTGLLTTIGEDEFPAIDDLALASALFAVWLGDDPISGDLKKDLLRLR